MAAIRQAEDILRPWLGSRFLASHAELPRRAAECVSLFLPGRDDLGKTAQALDAMLFMAVREGTNGRMVLLMDNGQSVRVRVADFELIADELMFLLFLRMPCDARSFLQIREYSVRSGSLSSLRALYQKYAGFQSAEELATVRRVIRSCHAPFRWRSWLE